ncbi:unnamed protein product [Orchesella dallaii]|uniref:FLYWCH-type domain-containing protein n=1 Tax=Orchesella dallaii TaxID=48710 RepID=A0ABP1QRA8_9HEXA
MAENTEPEVSTTPQKRNQREKLYFENKIYALNKETSTSKYYRCVRRECSGRCIEVDKKVTLTQQHSCLVASFECDIEKARNRVKQFSLENPFVAPSRVIAEVQQEFPVSILQALPKHTSMYRSIRKWRRPEGIKEPTQRLDIVFTDEQITTAIGTSSLFHDSKDERRILIFATEGCIQVCIK